MALTTVTVHGEILQPVTNEPAVGTVSFYTLVELRDVVDNIVYAPMTFTATLDVNGEFTIVVPATDNADLIPATWVYQVWINTDILNTVQYFQIPFQVGTVEFADLTPLDYDPCVGADLSPPEPFDLSVFVLRAGDTMTGDLNVEADLEVTGHTGLDTVTAAGNSSFGANLSIFDNLTVGGDAGVVGTVTASNVVTSDFTATIVEAETATVDRATLANPGTAADVWQFRYNGNRTIYGNEYNLLRVRGVPDDQVVARFMSNFARDGLSTAILQVTLSDALTHLFQVLGNGDILAAGGLSMLPTAYQPVVFTGSAAAAVLISDGATTGAPYTLGTTLHAAANRVYMDGAVVNGGGVSIPGGTVLFTIAAPHRPTAWIQFSVRTSTTLSARVTIRPDGTVRLDQPLAAGATCSFDGLNWRKN